MVSVGSVRKAVLPQLVVDPFRIFEGWNRKFDCPVAPHVPVKWYWRLTGPIVWVSSVKWMIKERGRSHSMFVALSEVTLQKSRRRCCWTQASVNCFSL